MSPLGDHPEAGPAGSSGPGWNRSPHSLRGAGPLADAVDPRHLSRHPDVRPGRAGAPRNPLHPQCSGLGPVHDRHPVRRRRGGKRPGLDVPPVRDPAGSVGPQAAPLPGDNLGGRDHGCRDRLPQPLASDGESRTAKASVCLGCRDTTQKQAPAGFSRVASLRRVAPIAIRVIRSLGQQRHGRVARLVRAAGPPEAHPARTAEEKVSGFGSKTRSSFHG